MAEKKEKLLENKQKTEEKIKTVQVKLKSLNQELESSQSKLKIINQELENIELQDKLKSTDEIVGLLQGKGVTDISEFIDLIKAGKVNIDNK